MNSMTAHPCDCGCSKCKEQCCELECLVQPRFFCGQLLSDQDLTAMLDWVKGKNALIRYRHGWGVVCGLEVLCECDRATGAVVGVSPGYAIDCCGNDIIVCCEAKLDLSSCCQPPAPPCNGSAPAVRQQPDNNDQQSFGPFKLPKREVQAVDLFIRYSETQSDPKSGIARGGCNNTAACEYTRTHEGYELYCKAVDDCDDPSDKRANLWYRAYREGLSGLFETLEKLHRADDPQQTITNLLFWMQKHPQREFCFLSEYLCDLQRNGQFDEDWFKELVFWIVQDWRSSFFRCGCEGCGPDTGVRLARVWLWRRMDKNGKQVLKIIYINAYPPFRRPLTHDCWPVPSDCVTLAPYVWQTADSSCAPLRKLGFADIRLVPFEYRDLEDFREQLRREQVYVCCADRDRTGKLVAYYRKDYCGQLRVVCFGPAEGEPQRPAVDPLNLAPDAPELDVERVYGIGGASAKRLRQAGIRNLVDLSNASPQMVRDALSSLPIQQPDETRCAKFIEEAKLALERLKAGS